MAEPKPFAHTPEDNLPGHHPDVEQDKPQGPPPKPRARAKKATAPPPTYQTAFRRDEPFPTVSRAFGVTKETEFVRVDADELEIRFGPWHLKTPLTNIESASVTGPFQWWKVIGPPHVSLKDRGITFATAADRGVCIRFREPVPGIEPRGIIRHPGATVTVADPEDLVRRLSQRAA